MQSCDLMRPEKDSQLVPVLNPARPRNIFIRCLNVRVGHPIFTYGIEQLGVAQFPTENKLDVADFCRFVIFAPSVLFAQIRSKTRHTDAAFISHF